MSTITLASGFVHTQPKRFLPTLRGYVHVFNKSTRKSTFLSPQPNALCAELQPAYESAQFFDNKMARINAKLDAFIKQLLPA